MQLQKLVYFAQGYSLALLDRPLTRDNVHAWQYGPVFKKLYKKLRKYGAGIVKEKIAAEESIPLDSEEWQLVKGVWSVYSHLTGGQLSALTHADDTPWSTAWAEEEYSVIPVDEIQKHFKDLVSDEG